MDLGCLYESQMSVYMVSAFAPLADARSGISGTAEIGAEAVVRRAGAKCQIFTTHTAEIFRNEDGYLDFQCSKTSCPSLQKLLSGYRGYCIPPPFLQPLPCGIPRSCSCRDYMKCCASTPCGSVRPCRGVRLAYFCPHRAGASRPCSAPPNFVQ